MTTSDIRSATVKAQVEAEDYRRAVLKLCDDYDRLKAEHEDLVIAVQDLRCADEGE